MDFLDSVEKTVVNENEVVIFWLGQAGFLLKTAQGKYIAIDPFLSDCVYRITKKKGFKRLMSPPCEASKLNLDVLIISHEHNDHFDVDSIKDLVKEKTHVYTNCEVAKQMEQMELDTSRVHVVKKDTRIDIGEFILHVVDCDHGPFTPEALGFVLDFGFSRLYYAGDTSLSLDRLKTPIEMQPEIVILPVNGAYGNLDGIQASQYAGMLNAKACIPCHFWTFPLHHGEPQDIIDHIKENAPQCELALLSQGECYRMRENR